MSVTERLPEWGLILPEGWVRLRFDETIDAQVAATIATILRDIDAQRRDMVRIALGRMFADIVAKASRDAYEVWMPVAPTGGVSIPLTITVAPPPTALDPRRSNVDHLTAFAASAAGSQFTEIGGREAVRFASDIAGARTSEGEWTSLPRRRVTTIVAPPPGEGWLVFFAEIVVPEEDAAEIVAACEFFLTAMLSSVWFPTSAEVES